MTTSRPSRIRAGLAASVLALAVAAPVATAAPASAAGCDYYPGSAEPTVAVGSRGAAVKEAQCILNATRQRGTSAIAVDGIFGSGTRAAVIRFQQGTGGAAALTPDGVVGPRTWRTMHAVMG